MVSCVQPAGGDPAGCDTLLLLGQQLIESFGADFAAVAKHQQRLSKDKLCRACNKCRNHAVRPTQRLLRHADWLLQKIYFWKLSYSLSYGLLVSDFCYFDCNKHLERFNMRSVLGFDGAVNDCNHCDCSCTAGFSSRRPPQHSHQCSSRSVAESTAATGAAAR